MKNRAKGFTLIETITVLALICLLSTMVLPGFQHIYESSKLRIAALELAQNIQIIQQRAITDRKEWTIVFNSVDKDRYQIRQSIRAQRVDLPSGVFIRRNNFPNNTLSFNSSGAPGTGGHIVITNNNKSLYIVVSVATGRVRISESPPKV